MKNSGNVKEYQFMSNLKNNINILRGDMTLSELAEKSEISIYTLNSLLYLAKTNCNLSTIMAISKGLGVSIDTLVSGEVCV